MQERWTAVDRYFSEALAPSDPSLDAALRDSASAGLPAIHVAPNQGKLLHLLARSVRAMSILEIGTLGAYSTIWLARALAPGGRLVTLEADPIHAEVARINIARAGLNDFVELRLGKAGATLPALAAEGRGPFDFVFIDADKPGNPEYFSWALRMSRPGTMIVVDNVVRDGAVLHSASTDADVQGVRRLVELLRTEPRVTCTALQTVGVKGYDGFVMAIVN